MLRQRKVWLGGLFALAAASVAGIASTPVAASSTLDWTQVTGSGPAAREYAYAAYDSGRGRTVLFGGVETLSTGYKYDSDTWEFDGSTWTQVSTNGPPASALGAMAYDSNRGVSVLFGGGTATGFLPAATWEWNGTAWTQRSTAHTPPLRVWNGLTYDSTRHVVVLFGGSSVDAGGNHILLNDTWEYDGNDWTQVLTTQSPSVRYGLSLAYDSGRGKTVLFGGHDDTTGRLQDTWEYDGAAWTQVAIANPPYARFLYSMAYDSALARVVMFGGDYLVPNVTLGPNNETWSYDGTTWQLVQTTDRPGPRAAASMVYDSVHSNLVLFGGTTEAPDQALGDTWTFGNVGPVPGAALSATSLQFGQQPVLYKTTQPVTLTNSGTAPLTITSIGAGGDFTTADNCPRSPSTLGAGLACTINVSYTPTTGDGQTVHGTLTVTDDAGLGTQTVALSGSGEFGFMSPSPSPLDLGATVAGTTATAVETLTFPAQATVLTGFSASAPFFVNNLDCPLNTLLSGGAACHLQVGFAPQSPGSYSGQLVVNDDELGLSHAVSLTGTGLPFPLVAITLNVTPTTGTFAHSLTVQATTNAASGTATFTFNGQQIGGPVALNGGGVVSQVIALNDSTIPAGAGTYPLVVSVHPTDNQHSDNSATQQVVVGRAPEQLSWGGTGLAVAGSLPVLWANVAPPPGETQFYDFADHPAFVRFDITDSTGATSSYFGLVTDVTPPSGYAGQGTATVNAAAIAPGAYSVRARLVSASGTDAANAYVTSEDMRVAYAGVPARGGYIAGVDQELAQQVAFEFAPGSTATGSLVWIERVQVTGPHGDQRDAFRIITSTSVSSVGSHSHIATASGTATVMVVDASTGVRYSAFDQTTTFQLTLNADGSAFISTGAGLTASLPAGSGVNHL